MSGLLAARALSQLFERVTIIEKDLVPQGTSPRKSVPQGNHAHGLLSRGRDVIETLLPGICEELMESGALAVDYLDDMVWVNGGQPICAGPSPITGLLLSRPMLEAHVRERVLQSRNIDFLDGTAVTELLTSSEGRQVFGVCCDDGERRKTLSADLVVDASGRGSRTPEWLRRMGYQAPREELVKVGVTYTTSTFRRRPEDINGTLGAVIAASGPDWRCGAMLAQEGGRWIVSLGGYFGDRAPKDRDGFLAFAKTLPIPHFYDVLKDAEPLTPFLTYSFPASLRRHYEELKDFPESYLVVGDALCSFNPIYGQGMTVAALEAEALDRILNAGSERFAQRFFNTAKSLIDVPWDIVVGNDLQHPRMTERGTVRLQLINWYLHRLKRHLPSDVAVSSSFLSVSNMQSPPSSLFRPSIVGRVVAGGLRP